MGLGVVSGLAGTTSAAIAKTSPMTRSPFRVAQAAPGSAANPIMDVGIVQRFGDEASDEITLEALGGDRLTVTLVTSGQEQTVAASTVTVDVVMEALAAPEVVERVVLSSHRSFESAEDSANFWRSQGIEVEIAQPKMWEVWAKRDIYRTPLLRRLLLHSIQANGTRTAFLDAETRRQRPQASLVMNGYRYARDRFEIRSNNSRIRVEHEDGTQRLYGGEMRFQPNSYDTYTLVNEVPVETYLRGVVPHEIGLGAPRTAIEAQAVLARTYALRNLRRFKIDGYELCADTQCQVYWGLGGAADVTDQAIAATRSQVLTYRNELIDALYSSTTGGITAPFSHVWNGSDRPYLRAVIDSVNNLWDLSARPLSNEQNFRAFMNLSSGFNEEEWDTFRWRREGTLESLADDLRKYLRVVQHPLVNFTRLERLEVTERAPSGRVQTLVAMTDLGAIELKKDEVVRALYPPRSTLFYLEPTFQAQASNPTEPGIRPISSSAAAGAAVAVAANAQDTDPSEESLEGSSKSTPDGAALDKQNPTPVLKGYTFVGGGFGHGVGMSQTGAYRLGELGWSSDRILDFYYRGSELKVLNEEIVYWREPNQTPDNTASMPEDTESNSASQESQDPAAPSLEF
ncbi:MAG: SpoIID/LytB domain-containing protein [Elainellaceae cyanobacterium]